MRHFAPMHRFSSFACAALAGALLATLLHPGLVSAVALGNIALQSSLGQPLRVVIPVALTAGEIINTSCLKLVNDSEPGTPQLLTGRVSVERNAANTRLVVTTPRAVDEPTLRISLQAGCGNTVRRDYVLLLDPQGTRSDAIAASADVDEFRSYAASAPPAVAKHHPQRVAVAEHLPPAARDAAPARTTFTPIAAPAPVAVAVARAQKPVAPVQIASIATPPPPSQPEPVTLTAVQPPSGLIAEAAAASLSPVSTTTTNTPAPLAASLPRTQAPAPDDSTLWTQTWPYAAILLSMAAIALTAFAKRRGITVPAWGAPTVLNDSKSPMGSTGAQNTFAHFGAMSEAAPLPKRPTMAYPTVSDDDSTYDASLDTLLEQIQGDAIDPNAVHGNEIDEHTVRKAWATLASENSVDIGTDSILKAIAQAEREMRIGPPEPKQAAIDNALDDELMRVSKART